MESGVVLCGGLDSALGIKRGRISQYQVWKFWLRNRKAGGGVTKLICRVTLFTPLSASLWLSVKPPCSKAPATSK